VVVAVPTPAPPTPEPTPAGEGLLQVAAKPWGEVTVDGRAIGSTPLDRLTLSAGVHVVKIRFPGYQAVERRVVVHAGQTEKLVVDFNTEGVRN
jgi:serine/threonine-protein kinase